jgi:fructoselysine 3-epimerase
MKLAFSTNAYTRFPLLEALRDISAAGFEGVEILADAPHAYPTAIDPYLTDSVISTLDSLGLSVSNVNVNCSFGYWKDAPPEAYFEPSLISPNARHRSDRASMILRAMQFAKAIGARNISITSGRMLGGMPPDLAARQFAESIKPILETAEKLQIHVGIECEPGLFLEYVQELCDWIDRLGSARLGANLDIGHSQVIGESIPTVIRQLRGRIWNLHVEDIPGRKHYHLIPGEGTLDWAAVAGALDAIGYDRFATVELYTHTADPQSAARQSMAFFKKIGFGEPRATSARRA